MTDYTFSTPRPIALTVNNLGGKVTIMATEDGLTTVALSGDRAEEVSVTQDGDAVTVLSPNFDWTNSWLMRNWFRRYRIDIVIAAPVGSDLTLRLGGGDTEIIGEFGRVEAQPGAGDIHMTDACGPTSVRLGAGTITIDSITGQTRMTNGAGTIHIGQAAADTNLQLGTGDVTIESVTAPVHVKSGAGNVNVAAVAGDLTIDTSLGGTRVDRMSSGRLSCKGTTGDVRIGVPAGTPTWTDLSTVAGRVTNNLPSVGQPMPGQDHVELRVSMVSGAIELLPV